MNAKTHETMNKNNRPYVDPDMKTVVMEHRAALLVFSDGEDGNAPRLNIDDTE